jgi:hypothetical protein
MKLRGMIWFCMMVAVAQAARAIDNDNDGMSDVWQSLYGIGAEQAADDPDGDGDINLHEAWAGTDPGDSNSNSRLNNSRNGDQVTLTWSGVTRMPYVVQTSTNLISWSTVGGEVVSLGDTEIASGSLSSTVKRYYRLRIRSSLDSDSDQLRDWEEFILGTSESSWDSDGDLMPDGWEYTYMLDPFTDDSGDDNDGDGVSNFDEYINGTNPQDWESF